MDLEAWGCRLRGDVMIFVLTALAGATALSSPTVSSPPASQPVAVAPIAPIAPAGQAVLRTGTEVPLRLSEQLTTKNKQVRVGQRFRMEVAESVKVDGQVVIPVGSPAMGEVTDVRNKGMWGKSGHIGARVLYVQTNGRQIRLSGTFDDKGVTGTGAVVASILLVPVVGFFTTGTSAEIRSGASLKAFVDEDVPLAFAAQSVSTPMVIPAAPAAMAVPVAAPVSQPVSAGPLSGPVPVSLPASNIGAGSASAAPTSH